MRRTRRRSDDPYGLYGPSIGAGFVPGVSISYHARYDANNGGSTTQITDSSGSALAALAFGATTAAPTYLPYSGTPYVWLPGSSTVNAISGPNLTHTGDFTGRMRVRYLSSTAASSDLFSDRGTTTGEAALRYGASNTTLNFLWWEAGVAVQATSTAHGVVDGTDVWWGVERINNNGGVYRVRFYKSTAVSPSTTGWSDWTLISSHDGAAVANPTAIVQGTRIGNPTVTLLAYAYRLITTNNGATTADWEASKQTQTSYTDSYGNIWTIARATTVTSKTTVRSAAANDTFSGVLTDGVNDIATGPVAAVPPLAAADACTLFCVVRPWATLAASMTFFSTRSGAGAGVTLRMATATTVVADISNGTTTVTTPAVTIVPGTRYVLGVVVPATGGAYVFANTTTGATVARTGGTETGGALTTFADSTPANFLPTQARVPYAATAYALSVGERSSLMSEYLGGA